MIGRHQFPSLNRRTVIFQVFRKELGDCRMGLPLVLFDGETVVGSRFHNLLGDRRLTSHRVDGDQTPLDLQQFQQ
jgi:hypothetical protein